MYNFGGALHNVIIMGVKKAVLEKWVVAQKRHRLSDKHVQMARELGLNPDKLGKIDNHEQEPWKVPLPQLIEEIYFKQFKKEMPDEVKPLEQIIKERKIKDEKAKKEKQKRRALQAAEVSNTVDEAPVETTTPD